jgi:hypothetical protein
VCLRCYKLGRRCHQRLALERHGMAIPRRIPSFFVPTKPTRCGWRSIIRYCRLRELRRLYFPTFPCGERPKDLAWFAWMALPGLISLPLA